MCVNLILEAGGNPAQMLLCATENRWENIVKLLVKAVFETFTGCRS